jgi:putative flippase GtrA
MSKIASFFCVGWVGLFVDESMLYVLINYFFLNPYIGRLISVFLATIAVWTLNRKYTFDPSDKPKHIEFLHYLGTTSIGLGINVIVYVIALAFIDNPYIALFIGTGTAFFFNYWVVSRFVFTSTAKE